ncbi:MAG: MFS transporter [Anaerolineae bacterium]|nr:MFS transporter [Anaerolineae bacterium]
MSNDTYIDKQGPGARLRTLYQEFPRTFWTLVGATFIDRIGGAVLFPFFALYVTSKFGVGMTEAGLFFSVFAASRLAGGGLGGALTDRFGRRTVLIVGLVGSGAASLGIGLVTSFALLFVFDVFAGVFGGVGRPAQEAMVADLLPEEKRADGFAVLRVVNNAAIALGPAIGGFIAARSYLALFVIDAVASVITASLVIWLLEETRPAPDGGGDELSLGQTVRGYTVVLHDRRFMGFVLTMILLTMGYTQIFSTLSVYLRDVHGVPEQHYGWLISVNATMVVLLQFSVTRYAKRFRPLRVMVTGALLYAAGLALFGVTSSYWLFVAAVAIATLGELLVQPTAHALVARFAPEMMRGRYMAIYGFTWPVAQGVGPLAAGLIMDNIDPRLVWFAGAALATAAAVGFLSLSRRN